MGLGIKVVSGGEGSTNYVDWTPDFTLVGDKFVAEKSYEVVMDEGVFGQNSPDGFYELNKSAVLKYNNGEEGYFPIPKAKPFVINVEKELVENGQEINGKEFRFKISGNDKIYSISSGDTNTIGVVTPIRIGTEYTIAEEAWVPEGNAVNFENYKVEYEGNKFVIGTNYNDEVKVKIKNIYETTNVEVAKKWNDGDDRDKLRDGYNLYAAVKDGNKYVAYQSIESEDNNYTFTNLPKYRNGNEIDYTVVEAEKCTTSENGMMTCTDFTGDANYEVEIKDNTITNFHAPATTSVLIKKTWATTATTLPNSITVNLTGGEVNQTFDITADDKVDGECTEWCKKIDGLYKYENSEEIEYTVRETNIFGVSADGFIEYGTDETTDGQKAVNGKWDARSEKNTEDWTITNIWTPAISLFNGSTDFAIKKIDKNGNPLSGVKFTINGEEFITGEDGKILVEIPVNQLVSSETKNYEIIETVAKDGYDLDGDKANLEVVIESGLVSVNEATLVNTYNKTFTFTASGNKNYVWNKEERMFILENKRSEAKSLTIEKTFNGIDEGVLKESDLVFTVSGPDDFGTKNIPFSDFTISDGKGTYVLKNVPTGDYTVEEKGGEFKNSFILTTTGDNGATKTLAKGNAVKFAINNEYAAIADVAYEVAKIWDDDNDRDGIRPEKLSVDLMANGSKVETVNLEGDSWSYKWKNLPRVNEKNETLTYSVVEKVTSGYKQTNVETEDGKTTFINKHTPAMINEEDDDPENDGKLTVVKIWEDGDDLLQFRPKMIMVNLLANGEVIETVPIVENADGLWMYTFTGLYKFTDGEEIEYTIEEDKADGYTAKISGSVSSGFEIVNTSTNPCSFGGCGHGEDEKPNTPNTGKMTISGDVAGVVNSSIVTTILSGTILAFLVVALKRNKKEA